MAVAGRRCEKLFRRPLYGTRAGYHHGGKQALVLRSQLGERMRHRHLTLLAPGFCLYHVPGDSMTLDPRIGLYLSLAAAILAFLVTGSAEFTDLFGADNARRILAALGLTNGVVS